MSDRTNVFEMGPDGTIRIPEEVLRKAGWKAGQLFAIEETDGKAVLIAVPSADDLFGRMKGANPHGYRDRDDRY